MRPTSRRQRDGTAGARRGGRGLRRLLVVAAVAAAVLAWRERQIAGNQRRFNLP